MLKRTPHLLFKTLVKSYPSIKAFPASSINWLNLKIRTPFFQAQVFIYHYSSNIPRKTEYQEEDLALFNDYEPEKISEMRQAMEKYLQCKDLNLLTPDEISLISEILGNIGVLYIAQEKQDKGQRYLREQEDLDRKTGAKDNMNLASNFHLQASFHLQQNNLPEVKRYLTEAERICNLFKEDPEAKNLLVQICSSFAQLCMKQNDQDQALKLYQSVIERIDDLFEEERPSTIMIASQAMGNIYDSRNDLEKAAENYTRCLETEIKYSGENTQMAHIFAQQLTNFLYGTEQFQKALPSAKQALKIALQVLPKDHLEIAFSYSRLGHIYIHEKKLPKALDSFKKATRILEKQLPQNISTFTATCLSNCYFQSGLILALQGNPQEASDYLAKAGSSIALALNGKELGDKYFEWGKELNIIGNMLEETKIYFLKAAEIYESVENSNQTLIPYIYATLGNISFMQQDWGKACEFMKRAEGYFAKGGMNIDDMQTTYSLFSTASMNSGNLDDAVKYSQKVLECYETTRDPQGVSGAYFYLGLKSEHEEKFTEALEAFQKSLEFPEATGPSARLINQKVIEFERKLQKRRN